MPNPLLEKEFPVGGAISQVALFSPKMAETFSLPSIFYQSTRLLSLLPLFPIFMKIYRNYY